MKVNIWDKFTSIVTGWWNYLTRDPQAEGWAKQRAVHCANCPHKTKSIAGGVKDRNIPEISGMHCDLCGCPLATKLRVWDESCPKDVPEWGPMVVKKVSFYDRWIAPLSKFIPKLPGR